MASMIEKFSEFEKSSELFLKGYNYAEIGRELGITQAAAKSYVNEYKKFINERANDDPDFLDRIAENTLQLLDEVSMLSKEAWRIYEKAVELDTLSQMAPALKLAGEFTDKKAKLLQLMGAKTDSGSMARMQRAERVNEIVSMVLKEIIAQCPKCRIEAQPRLAEAFALMNKQDMGDPQPIQDDIIDIEVEDEEDS